MENQTGAPVMVSVIITTYNQKQYVEQALESVLMQKTTFPYEVLVGDDASSDGTGDIIEGYARQNPGIVHAVKRKNNLGPTKNVYDLLLRAKGKYIANCEGDDYWIDCKKLQLQVDFLEQHPTYSGCTHDCRIIDENGIPLPEQRLDWISAKTVFTQKDFKGIYLPGQPTTWVHRNFFQDKNHDFSIIYQANRYVGDRTVTLILSMYGPIYHMDSVMSCYRKQSASLAQNATSIVFARNQSVNQMQYELTLALEKYVREEFGVPLHFTKFKMEQWTKMKIRKLILTLRRKLGGLKK